LVVNQFPSMLSSCAAKRQTPTLNAERLRRRTPPSRALDDNGGRRAGTVFLPLDKLHHGIDEGCRIERQRGQVVTLPSRH